MLTALFSFLGSSTIGSLVGWVGGALNRYLDLKKTAMDNDFELKKLAATQDFMLKEAEVSLQTAKVTADASIEVAGYQAMKDSYDADQATYGTTWNGRLVDTVRGLIRPTLTMAFFFLNFWLMYEVMSSMAKNQLLPSADQLYALADLLVKWALFQGGVCIGWWFASRPSKQSIRSSLCVNL